MSYSTYLVLSFSFSNLPFLECGRIPRLNAFTQTAETGFL